MEDFTFERDCRTPYSESYLIVENDRPVGRIELHFTSTIVHGTLCITEDAGQEGIREVIRAIDQELVDVAGVRREELIIHVFEGREIWDLRRSQLRAERQRLGEDMNGNIPAPPPVVRLIKELHRLPGIGPKSAQRLAYFIIRQPEEEAQELAEAILGVKERIIFCSVCQNLTEIDPCDLCSGSRRDRSQVCVVEEPMDVLALERAGFYRGLYHILHGVISPMNGVGPDDVRIRELLPRLEDGTVKEVIIGVNPTLEGDATAMYLHGLIRPLGIKVSNLARGLPVGGHIEYADDITLSRAFQGRQEL